MQVTLLHNTPLLIADKGISKCWDKPSNGECNIERMKRVAIKFKHASTIEHLSYNFDIDGISRALLQELARHRISSFSVKSSRYTLGELRGEKSFTEKNVYGEKKAISIYNRQRAREYIVFTGAELVDNASIWALEELRKILTSGISNDLAKYCLPESYKTSLVWTVNARSLQNFLKLRTDKSALWEIRKLAYEVFNQLPEDHKFLFTDFLYKEKEEVKIDMVEMRDLHFIETGMYATDKEIIEWLKDK